MNEDGLSILTKENVAVSDSGVYTCVAVSIAGQARHDIMATVYRAPTIEIVGEDGDVDLTGTSKVQGFINSIVLNVSSKMGVYSKAYKFKHDNI